MQGGGISLSEVDNVISAFEEYKNDIQTFLDQISENPNYTQAYKGFEKAVQAYVDQICETVKTGVIHRIDATIQALKTAKEEYSAKSEAVDTDVRGDATSFSFEGKM